MNESKKNAKKTRPAKSAFGCDPCGCTLMRAPFLRRDEGGPHSPCRRAVITATALALAGVLGTSGVPALALESDPVSSERTTTVSLQGTVSQLSVTVPTAMPVKVKGDGSFVETGIEIQNNSIFDVHVSSISTQATEPFSVLSKEAFDQAVDDSDVLWMTLSAGTHSVDLGEAVGEAVSLADPQWNVPSVESGTGSLSIVSNGAIKNVESLTSSQEEALKISFTVEAGSN